MDPHECQVCGEPATQVVSDHEQLPEETYWAVEADSPPWHLCAGHATFARTEKRTTKGE